MTLHFISTKEVLHSVDLVQLIDDDTGFITNLRDVIQVNVVKNESGFMTNLRNAIQSNVAKNKRSMKRIDHNSFVSRHIAVAS